MASEIKLGTNQVVSANDVVDASGNPVTDFTGWTARGAVRAGNARGEVLATFDDTPDPGEAPVTFDGPNSRVSIEITPEMNLGWSAHQVLIQLKIWNPAGKVARIIDKTYPLNPDAVPQE